MQKKKQPTEILIQFKSINDSQTMFLTVTPELFRKGIPSKQSNFLLNKYDHVR